MFVTSLNKKFNKIQNRDYCHSQILFTSDKNDNFDDQNFSSENLKDYSFSQKYYNNKIKKNGKLFDNVEDFEKVVSDKKSFQNLQFFIHNRAEDELRMIQSKLSTTLEEKEKIEALKEIKSSFPSVQSYQTNNVINFRGNIDKTQRKQCHIAIHSTSAACAGISATMGEGAAVGADTPFLQGTQYLMFNILRPILGVKDIGAHIQYIGRQYLMGQSLGVKGAQFLCSWLGITATAATAGVAAPVASVAVRAVNASLSAAITEKMGWGYVSSYKNDSMTWGKQLFQNAIYLAGSNFFGDHSNLPNDPSDMSDIVGSINKLPKQDVSLYGSIFHNLYTNSNIRRPAIIIASSVINAHIFSRSKDEETKKRNMRIAVSSAIFNSVLYELLNLADDREITNESVETIKNLGDELNNTPEVFQEFKKSEQELLDKINFDTLDSQDFIKQFKDKNFTYNVALTSSEVTKMIADKWRKRNFDSLKQQNKDLSNDINKINNTTDNINNSISSEEAKDFDADFQNIIQSAKERLKNGGKSNFALNKIAGYEGTKALLNITFIDPIKNKQENVPNAVLFFGPSGNGKTTLGRAVAEDTGSLFKGKDIGFGDEKEEFKRIEGWLKTAEEQYQETGRYTIIQLNEFDDFINNNPELLKKFNNILKECSKKNHCSFFITTNNPLKVNNDILSNIDLKLPIGVATKEDAKDIINHYLGDNENNGVGIDNIVDGLEFVKPNSAYSNAQIEEFITKQKIKPDMTQEEISGIIQKTKPRISEDVIDKFNNEKKQICGDM